MNVLFVVVFVLFTVAQYRCETPSCNTNCTTNRECWREAITYRSSELIKHIFSFSSLSVHVDTYQRKHPKEVNGSILFIDKVLENHLLNESIDSNLTMNLFIETKQILIDLCTNLTSTPINETGKLPSLICSLSTCTSDAMNVMVLSIISVLITGSILLIYILQSSQAHRQVNQ